MAKKQRHSGLVKGVIEWLTLHKWFVYWNKAHTLHGGSYKGLSDLTAIKRQYIPTTAPLRYYTRVIWIECKVGRDQLSPHQEQFKKDIEEHGGEFLVVRDLDDLHGLE